MATPHHGTAFWKTLLYAAAVALQTAAWFSVLYCFYYVVPIYKFVLRDLNVVNASGSFPTVVAASDFVVIYSHSDALFPWLLIVFLIGLVGLNVIVMKRMNKQRAHLVWLAVMVLVPLCVLAFQVTSLADVRRQIINERPKVLEYGVPWISR
jgi:cytochrome c oxidase subunit IV